jgi:patatin-like phospholipase/acyl hydrolase
MALELNGKPANLLSLDGGGIKGISTLWVLKIIMDKVKEIEKRRKVNLDDAPRKPVDYFHMAAGTSTGGIIALMLFRLRMTTEQAIEEYMKIGPKVFETKAKLGPARFPPDGLLNSINAVVAGYAETKEEQNAKGDTSLVDNKAKMLE